MTKGIKFFRKSHRFTGPPIRAVFEYNGNLFQRNIIITQEWHQINSNNVYHKETKMLPHNDSLKVKI